MNEQKFPFRTSSAKITLNNIDGSLYADKSVHVQLINHEFLFGQGAFDVLQYTNAIQSNDDSKIEFFKQRVDRFLELYNYGTLPFYWGIFEETEGNPATDNLKAAATFLKDHDVKVKGHPLCWHTVCAPWLLKYDDETILQKQLQRIDREVSDFKGLVDIWDVINEVCIMDKFDKYDNAVTRICRYKGRVPLTSLVFNRAVQNNLDGTFLINDFNTTVRYEELLQELLENNVPISAIGIQSHQHQGYWGLEKLNDVLTRFEKFNLPIHFTENTILSGFPVPPEIEDLNDFHADNWPTTPEGEEKQSKEIIEMYRVLFSHPLVKAITGWDLCDGMWLNAPSGILRKDNSPKPVFYALKDLIHHELSTSYETKTNAAGEFILTGYKGKYKISYGNNSSVIELS